MAALGKASRVLLPLAVAVAALSLAVFSGREASRHLGGGAPSLEVLSSGLDQMRSFVGDLLYLKIDRYHHIWMYQGHEWEQATDYLPMIWLVSRLKPEYARNYIDGGHHLAINLGRVTEGVDFMRRGLQRCPGSLELAWEYAVVLWQTGYGTPIQRQRAVWDYLSMIRRRRGNMDDPWNEYNAFTMLRELFEADSTRQNHARIAARYGELHRNRVRLRRMQAAVSAI